jgi:hypothetical protein
VSRFSAPLALAVTLASITPSRRLRASPTAIVAPAAATRGRREDVRSASAIVAAFYDLLSAPSGSTRDWGRLRSLLMPGAALTATTVQRDGTTSITRLDVEGYIARRDCSRDGAGTATTAVDTTPSRPAAGTPPPSDSGLPVPTRAAPDGINTIRLFDDGTRWWVAGAGWEAERPGALVPRGQLRRN